MKLSIIIPVYNTEAYLAKCLDSLLDPACRDYEIIVVNDGSTDGSRAVMTDYVRRYPGLIHPVDTPNGGLGHARNTGLAAAKGEWVLFVDSDDYLAPHAVKEILEILDEEPGDPFDIAVFDFVHVNEEGSVLASFSGCEKEEPPGMVLLPAAQRLHHEFHRCCPQYRNDDRDGKCTGLLSRTRKMDAVPPAAGIHVFLP